jgi:hypothetical protein
LKDDGGWDRKKENLVIFRGMLKALQKQGFVSRFIFRRKLRLNIIAGIFNYFG